MRNSNLKISARNKKRTSGEVKNLFAQKINLSRFFQNKDTLADLQIITSDIERFFSGLSRNTADKRRNTADKRRIIADKRRIIADKGRNTADKRRNTADKRRNTADKRRIIADKGRNTADKRRNIADKRRNIADKRRNTADKRRNTADKRRNTADKRRNTADIDRKSSNEKKCTAFKQKSELSNITGEIQSYLIYANGIISGTENTFPAVSIFITLAAGNSAIICIIILTYSGGKSFVIYWSFTDSAKIFDGVIERYCGVPP